MKIEHLSIDTHDNHRLAARHYRPAVDPVRAVLLVGAMGVPQRFYEAYARWLAQQGLAVLTFDFRGVGDSAPRHLRGFRASITDWAATDLPAAVQALQRRCPAVPLSYIGHSLGGQLFGWLGQGTRVFDRALTVASGNGHWRWNAPPTRSRAPFLWWLLVPLLTPLFGHFPGRRIGVVGDLPAGAMRQWRRWCLHPDYLGIEGPAVRARYAEVRTPITALLMPDDELVSPEGIRRLYKLYDGARVDIVEAQPRNWGRKRLGHFGVFRPSPDESLWRKTLSWLGEGP